MQLSKLSYYSDFVVYPLVLIALTAININHVTWASGAEWLAASMAGLVFWTLAEYALRRIALHRMPYFSPMHGLHHASPLALIGTPSWISVSVLSLAILVPAWLCLGFNVADGLTVGVMLGYSWYRLVHHVIHHHPHTPSPSYLHDLRAWHMRHPYPPRSRTFGGTRAGGDQVSTSAIAVRVK